MRFSGRLDAPALVSMHYPPETENEDLLATTDTKNPCLFLILSKLGLTHDEQTQHIAWTERVYLQTSTELRDRNKARPYEVCYDQVDLDRCKELNRRINELATYGARLMVNKEVVIEDITRAKSQTDWKLFTLPIEGGVFVPIYEQPFHGAVNVKTAQFHFFSYHTEGVLRDNISDRGLHLADTIVNIFAVLAGIRTVRQHGFANFKKSTLTDPALWRDASDNDGNGNVLDCAVQMRWVEKNRDHRFRISQLSQAMMYYVDKEGIVLSDDSVRTPVAQILGHMSRKTGQMNANKILPDGRKFLSVIGEKGREAQRAAGFNLQKAGLEAQHARGFPQLAANREAQRANDFPQLAANRDTQRTSGFNLQQAGLEAQRARGFPQLAANREAQRANGFPALEKGRETQRAEGFPGLKKGHETQRAEGFPGLKKGLETQRAQGFPGLKKGLETQRAAGFPQLATNREAQRANGYEGTKKALAVRHDLERSKGWPVLKRASEIGRPAAFAALREYDKKRQRVHYDKLQAEVEATNKRKAADDPSFEPPPHKEFEQRVVVKKRGHIPCQIPGCKSKLSNENTMKSHLSLHHGLWSAEAPFKCPRDDCNRYYASEKAASEHEYNAHTRGKVKCPTCDREMSVRHLPEHRRDFHGWEY
jgi:hypothetical protein